MRQQCVVLSAEQLLHVRLANAAPFDMLVLDEVRSLADKFKRQSTLSSYESVQQLQRVYETARFVCHHNVCDERRLARFFGIKRRGSARRTHWRDLGMLLRDGWLDATLGSDRMRRSARQTAQSTRLGA